MWPLLVPLGIVVAIAALSGGKAHASEAQHAYVETLKRKGTRGPVVQFSRVIVPWRIIKRKDKKTGKIRVIQQNRTTVSETPEDLAAAAGKRLGQQVSVDEFALATLVASEAGRGNLLAKAAVAWATKNMARKKGTSLFNLITWSTAANRAGSKVRSDDGLFGSQQGRYAASKESPTEQDIQIARDVLAEKIADPTKQGHPQGAVQWDSPSTQDKLTASEIPGYETTSKELERKRLDEGRRLVTLPGVDPNYLRLWA